MPNDVDKLELPPGLDLLWGRRSVGLRGPKAGMSVDDIVAAAIAIADAEGLEAVSMARVAKQLGFTTMSLYRHVSNKDELLQLMWNASADGVETIEITGETWRERFRCWALLQREAVERHIWIVHMPLATPPLAPNSLIWVERGLETLEGTGLTDATKMRLLGLVSAYTLIDARMADDVRKGVAKGGDQAPVEYSAVLREVLDVDRFPLLHRATFSGEIDEDPKDPFDEYGFDLDIILDGIEALIKRSS